MAGAPATPTANSRKSQQVGDVKNRALSNWAFWPHVAICWLSGNIYGERGVTPIKKPESYRLNPLGNIDSGLPVSPDPDRLGRRE